MKSPPSIPDDEKPFAIPPTWTWCRLGEIALQISKGTTPHGGNDSYVPQGISFLRAENVGNDGRLHLKSLKHITADVHEHELSRSILAAGDLLITIAGSLGHAAIVDAGILPANTNQAVSFVRLADLNSISVKYILLAIQSPVIQEMMLSKKKVTGVPNLTLEIISNLPIPLPPHAEQKRIVEALEGMLKAADAVATGMEKIAALKDKARAKILDLAIRGKLVKQDAADEPAEKLLARMRSGEFSHGERGEHGEKIGRVEGERCRKGRATSMKSPPPITDDEKPFAIPQGWAWCRLGEISDVQLGKMLDAKKNMGRECRYLANISVRWGGFDLNDLRTTFFTDDEVEKFSLRENDLLVCEGGAPGRCAVWRERDTDIKYQKAIHRVRPYAINADYLQHYFEAIHDRPFFASHFTGSTIHHLPREVLLNLPIPLPPLAEQQRIVAKVDEMLAACDALELGRGER